MDSLMEKENCQIEGMMLQIAGGKRVEREWIETDDDCAPFADVLELAKLNLYRLTANCRNMYSISVPM